MSQLRRPSPRRLARRGRKRRHGHIGLRTVNAQHELSLSVTDGVSVADAVMSHALLPSGSINQTGGLVDEFHKHVTKWKRDTRHTSSLASMISHPSYRRIIGMGRSVLPLLLTELSNTPNHWLVALNAITGLDPAPVGSSFHEAVEAWLQWGRKNGYLNTQWSETKNLKRIFLDCAGVDMILPVTRTLPITAWHGLSATHTSTGMMPEYQDITGHQEYRVPTR
jgi:hypothetical protein